MPQYHIPKGLSDWLKGDGVNGSIVISSRIRLARNLSDHLFPTLKDIPELEKVLGAVTEAAEKVKGIDSPKVYNLSKLSDIERRLLMERHLISHEHASNESYRGLIVNEKETISIMVNEEDHVRMSSFESGLALEPIWNRLNRIDDEFGKYLSWAFHRHWGYLTACPTNCGTGMRASVLIHMPALSLTGQINNIILDISKLGLVVRGFYGEGTKILGDMFQISNATTLGKTESEIIAHLERVIKRIIKYETDAQKKLTEDAFRVKTEDLIYRAYAVLSSARTISYEETLMLLSRIRLGKNIELKIPVSRACLNELMIIAQPAHIQNAVNKTLQPRERDIHRANLIRRIIGKHSK